MDQSSELEFCAIPSSANAPAVSAGCSDSVEYSSGRSESMSRGMGKSGPRAGRSGSIEEQIELSKSHWSELADSGSTCTDNDEVVADNLAMFEELQRHPSWGKFFKTFGYDTQVCDSEGTIEMGEKFAEGGQAEIFHAKIIWKNSEGNEEDVRNEDVRRRREWVLKVFKRGTLLRDLQKQWPHGYLHWWTQYSAHSQFGKPLAYRYMYAVQYGTLLRDGRFAFLMVKEHMDLRSFIDSRMLERSYGHGPFQEEDADWYMYCIALGMEWLHKQKVVHRDLKASNVLVHDDYGKYTCYVADYECSVGTIGTGFWRAPEILQVVKEKNVNQRPELFSVKADAYSYAMTYYEILTGKIPFEDHPMKKNRIWLTDLVINHDLRPELPNYVNVWIHDLLKRCWQSNPSSRPSFEEILEIFKAKSKSKRIKEWTTRQKILEVDGIKDSIASWVKKKIWKTIVCKC